MHVLFAPYLWIYLRNTHYPHLPQYSFLQKYRYVPDILRSYISDFT